MYKENESLTPWTLREDRELLRQGAFMTKSLKPYLAVALASLLQPGLASALPDYRCRIESVHRAATGPDAVLESERKSKVGKEFTVDRRSGRMIGALKNAYATEPVVIDYGSSENAFKAVTTMTRSQGLGHSSSLFALVINEFDEHPKKPFAFLSGDMVYFGRCEHFQ